MKLQHSNSAHNAGSVLLVTLLLSIILGVTLAGYLIMTLTQNRSVVRSQTWNSSIALTEAGVEDGLQEINKYAGAFDQLTNWISTASSDNWSMIDSNVYYVRRFLGEDYYDVYITNSTFTPTIYSSGTAMWHYNYASAAPQAMFAAIGTSPATCLTNISRAVVVHTKVDALWNVAMAALLTIDFNGKNITTDSFDSADANYSNWSTNLGYGFYPTGNLNKTKANGDVVTDYTITNSLSVGNAKIKGQAKTGPKGSLGINNGSVGDRAWVEGGNTGVQPGHFADDMNVLFPDAKLPGGTTWLPAVQAGNNGTPSQINGVNYDYIILTDGDYSIAGLNNGVYIGSNVTARIKCTGDVNLTGSSDQIHVAYGANVRFYMTASTFKVAGNGVVNENGNAASFYYFGLPSNTSVQFNGNASFTGAIYAPSAAFSLGGGGSDTYDFVGASVSKSVKMNGHFNFHYDENLARNGFGRGYIPTNWKES